jgi:flavin reductase (DIM6/NTAB) family NADH-FMN oxidoreductase RutF
VTALAQSLDPATLRQVFGAFPTGVTAVAALVGGAPVGLAASSFTSVSLDPPLVSFCIATTSRSWPVLRSTPRIGISVLADGHQDACRRLASRTDDRFTGLHWWSTDSGAVLLAGASAWLECSLDREFMAGDHHLALLAVHRLAVDAGTAPLVFHASKFRRLAD